MSIFALLKNSSDSYEAINVASLQESKNCNAIFLIARDDESCINQILLAIKKADSNLGAKCVPRVDRFDAGSNYVYGYFSPTVKNPSWDNVFYVGKGQNNRWVEHVRNVYRMFGKNIDPKGAKDIKIMDWIKGQNEAGEDAILQGAINDGLVRRLYEFEGECAEEQAFFVEQFLISRAGGGPYCLTNDTAGNKNVRASIGLARPLSFDCTIAWQVDIWNDVINAFRSHEFARIDNTCRPALLLIEAEKLVKQLTNVLRKVGLSPFDMRESPENRVKKMIAFDNFPSDLHHVSVSGAADLIASFHLDKNDAPLRFDFRISPCDNKTTLTLRPTVNTGESNRLFKTYLDNRPLNESEIQCSETSNIFRLPESYVKNRNNWPFYKPLTWQANGSTSAWFTVDDETQTNFSVDWIREKPVRLTLSEAIKMVIEVLC